MLGAFHSALVLDLRPSLIAEYQPRVTDSQSLGGSLAERGQTALPARRQIKTVGFLQMRPLSAELLECAHTSNRRGLA